MKTWETLSRRTILEHSKYLKVESHTIELPNGEIISDWPWIITPDAAIVLAMTANGKFLCFRQTKYGIDGTSLAPVGGHIESNENPLDAAKRELLEETGYEATDWVNLGSYTVGPNRGIAKRYLFLAQGAKKVTTPSSDDLEEQQLLFLNQSELKAALHQGEFKVMVWAAIVALALNFLSNGNERQPPPALC